VKNDVSTIQFTLDTFSELTLSWGYGLTFFIWIVHIFKYLFRFLVLRVPLLAYKTNLIDSENDTKPVWNLLI
jgi:hypothetical protein